MSRYKQFFLKFLKQEIVEGSFYLFIGGSIGSFLSFIFNLFLARTLTQGDYGAYTSLLSLETLITIPAASLTAVIIRFAGNYLARGEERKAAHLFRRMSLVWLLIGIAIFGFIYSLQFFFLNYLHLNNPLLILVVALGVAISYIGVVNTGFLQSMTKFRYISFTQIVGGIAKIAVGGVLVLAGTKAVGALFGILMLPLSAYILGFWPLRKIITRKSEKEETTETKEILRYGVLAAIGLISLSSFISTDVILVKHFFGSSQAGLYGGLSIIGKVIFYFTAPIPLVMFPLIVRKHTMKENYKSTFHLSLLLVLLPSLAITIFYFLFPNFTTTLFLGKNYSSAAQYLGLFGIFITLFNLASIITSFFISLKKTDVSFVIFSFALLQIALIYLFHSDFYHVIFSSIISLSLLLLALTVYYKLKKD